MCGRYSLTKFANFLIVLRAEIVTTFSSKMVTIFARNRMMRKFPNFVRLYLPHATTFFNHILELYYSWKVLFRRFRLYCLCQKLVYNAYCTLRMCWQM